MVYKFHVDKQIHFVDCTYDVAMRRACMSFMQHLL